MHIGRHEEQALLQKRCTAESDSRKRRQQKLLAQAEVRVFSMLWLEHCRHKFSTVMLTQGP